MARISNWNPERFDREFINVSMGRLRKAAEVIKNNTKANLWKQIGSGKTTGISHGPYKKGAYAGLNWTAREFGSLFKSVRVVEKKQVGTLIAYGGKNKNIRVYCGNYLVWYAKIIEYTTPFMRPALNSSRYRVRKILENG